MLGDFSERKGCVQQQSLCIKVLLWEGKACACKTHVEKANTAAKGLFLLMDRCTGLKQKNLEGEDKQLLDICHIFVLKMLLFPFEEQVL